MIYIKIVNYLEKLLNKKIIKLDYYMTDRGTATYDTPLYYCNGRLLQTSRYDVACKQFIIGLLFFTTKAKEKTRKFKN